MTLIYLSETEEKFVPDCQEWYSRIRYRKIHGRSCKGEFRKLTKKIEHIPQWVLKSPYVYEYIGKDKYSAVRNIVQRAYKSINIFN